MKVEKQWTDTKGRKIKMVLDSESADEIIFRDGVKYIDGGLDFMHIESWIPNPDRPGKKKRVEEVKITGSLRAGGIPAVEVPPELVKEIKAAYFDYDDDL